MRWVTILAAGYALSRMLAYADPARIAGLAAPAPWRPPGTRTAGLIQAGLARLLRGVDPPSGARSHENRTSSATDFPMGGHPRPPKPPEAVIQTSSHRPCRRGSLSRTNATACKLQLSWLRRKISSIHLTGYDNLAFSVRPRYDGSKAGIPERHV